MNQRKGFFYAMLRKRNLVLMLSAIVIAAGLLAYQILPKQQYPVVLTPAVTIVAVYPGAAPDEMEAMVAKPIEDMVMETAGYDFCYSQSMDSTCVVVVRFGLDLSGEELTASQTDLRNKTNDLWATTLPSGVTNVMFSVAEINTAGLILAFTGETQSSNELAERAGALKDKLQKLDGVQKVEVGGDAEERIVITVDMAKLNQMNLPLSALSSMIGYKNSIVPAGVLEFETDKITVNTSGMFESVEEIQNIIVDASTANGTVTRLKDIAEIKLEADEDAKTYQYNGNETILLSLFYSDGTNIVSAGKAVNAEIEAYQAGLPEGVELTTVFNMAEDVRVSVNDFIISVFQALLIVLVVVMAGMSLRNGGIVTVAIPVSLAVPFLVMLLTDIEVQFISLASLIIALGMLVDNAVVVSDSIQVLYDEGEERLDACAKGVKSVAFPVLASTMTTVSIFIMFYMLPGTMQSFVFSLPTIVIAALLASYVVSLCVTPVMCYLLMKKTDPNAVTMFTKLKGLFRHRVLGKTEPEKTKEHHSLLDTVGSVVSRLLNYGFDGFLDMLGNGVIIQARAVA
ncbi:MAG: efflux RND transporter permease subunit [Lachnospiraceae bacterium]